MNPLTRLAPLGASLLLVSSFGCAEPAAPPASSAATPPPGPIVATADSQQAPPPAAPAVSPSAPATPAATPPPIASGEDPSTGKPAPDFKATAQDGSAVQIAALKGKPVVLYFYPKDETPGCTKEACSFRDAWNAIAKTGAVLVGVSADSPESHKEFIAHHKLPFLLITDADGAIAKLYGVQFQGRHHRETFVIDKEGTVRKVYRNVDVSVHAQEVLSDLTHLG